MKTTNLVQCFFIVTTKYVMCAPADRLITEVVNKTYQTTYNLRNLVKEIKDDFIPDNIDLLEEEEVVSILAEDIELLTKIEILYNAFKSQDHQHKHPHKFPLLSVVETEPHSMTIMVTPELLKPETMVNI